MRPTTVTITPGTLPVPGNEKKRNTARNVALTALVLGGLTAGTLGTSAGRNVLKRASFGLRRNAPNRRMKPIGLASPDPWL